ncbi:MAG: glycosyltransferase [Acidocella sp.]|nr:glycosyltransferase [Acidocella sp.]
MPLPAYELLNPECAIKPAWAVFDPGWYLHHYADARAVCQNQPGPAASAYYLRVGARLGHSPNVVFDEIYYLDRNPDIAELVRAGAYQSGFDHYCQHGHRGVSPHWLFDDALYADLYEDMTLETLDAHGCFGRYDHYLKSGQREQRMGQFLFDGVFYRAMALAQGVAAARIDEAGPYVHCLNRLYSGEDELAPSIYFDPAWYIEHYPAAKAEIARGRYSSAIHHYLTSPAPEHLDPVPQFREAFYRQRYPDIAAAVAAGMYRSGYQQFVQYGAFELRQPCAEIDLVYYRDMNERVRNDLNTGDVRDAFAHLRMIGLREALAHSPPAARPTIDEAATRAQFIKKARHNLGYFACRRLDFTHEGAPEVSVIMVVCNRFELTMLALASLRDNMHGLIELIIVDNGSTDLSMRIEDYVLGAKILRMDRNLGFVLGCNAALEAVSAPAILFLNNDVELAHGALGAALARLSMADDIGAVAAKIIRSHGALQEAGSIIWRDATVMGYLRDASPLTPAANFVRDVDYGSAVFLLCRTGLLRALGGFDEAFAPAYFEDADLCVRIIQSGHRVVYDPAVMVHHLEYGSAATSEASMALMRRGRRIFRKKHEAFLRGQPDAKHEHMIRARSRGGRPVVLFIEDTIPRRCLGSGFVRSNDIVHAIAQAGYEVHVLPMNGARQVALCEFGDLPETAEILYDEDSTTLPAFLAARHGVYNAIWVGRTHNLARLAPVLAAAGISPADMPIILDTEALAANREAGAARLSATPFDLDAALRAELACAGDCRQVLGLNPQECAQLRGMGFKAVTMLGTAIQPRPTPADFAAREGLLFVGAIHQQDSPNLDALRWYVQDILPRLARLMGVVPVLHVAGYLAPGIDLGWLCGVTAIRHHGPVTDLAGLYNKARLFVAPTRFAAGTPYKIYEAAAHGLPCVTTDLLAGQLGWADGRHVATAAVVDAEAFAGRIAQVYGAADLWRQLRAAALAEITRAHRVEDFNAIVAGLLKKTGV